MGHASGLYWTRMAPVCFGSPYHKQTEATSCVETNEPELWCPPPRGFPLTTFTSQGTVQRTQERWREGGEQDGERQRKKKDRTETGSKNEGDGQIEGESERRQRERG